MSLANIILQRERLAENMKAYSRGQAAKWRDLPPLVSNIAGNSHFKRRLIVGHGRRLWALDDGLKVCVDLTTGNLVHKSGRPLTVTDILGIDPIELDVERLTAIFERFTPQLEPATT